MGSHLYLLLTLAFYAVGALHVVVHAFTRRRLLTTWPVTATLAGFAFHTASLSQRWTEAGGKGPSRAGRAPCPPLLP